MNLEGVSSCLPGYDEDSWVNNYRKNDCHEKQQKVFLNESFKKEEKKENLLGNDYTSSRRTTDDSVEATGKLSSVGHSCKSQAWIENRLLVQNKCSFGQVASSCPFRKTAEDSIPNIQTNPKTMYSASSCYDTSNYGMSLYAKFHDEEYYRDKSSVKGGVLCGDMVTKRDNGDKKQKSDLEEEEEKVCMIEVAVIQRKKIIRKEQGRESVTKDGVESQRCSGNPEEKKNICTSTIPDGNVLKNKSRFVYLKSAEKEKIEASIQLFNSFLEKNKQQIVKYQKYKKAVEGSTMHPYYKRKSVNNWKKIYESNSEIYKENIFKEKKEYGVDGEVNRMDELLFDFMCYLYLLFLNLTFFAFEKYEFSFSTNYIFMGLFFCFMFCIL